MGREKRRGDCDLTCLAYLGARKSNTEHLWEFNGHLLNLLMFLCTFDAWALGLGSRCTAHLRVWVREREGEKTGFRYCFLNTSGGVNPIHTGITFDKYRSSLSQSFSSLAS